MTRKCSHCSHDGHNSRTCPRNNTANRVAGVRLFGVRLTDGSSSIRKCASMGNLTHISSPATTSSNCGGAGLASAPGTADGASAAGYASEDCAQGLHSSGCRDQRKKGVPWTEEEHRMFLVGLQKLGKGDWRGIARNYVISRTPTQVASHAQKYFIRQTNSSRRKRRSSLFDLAQYEAIDSKLEEHEDGVVEEAQLVDGGCESMDSTNSNDADLVMVSPSKPEGEEEGEGGGGGEGYGEEEEVGNKSSNYPMIFPAYFPSPFPYPCPYTYTFSSPSPSSSQSWPQPEREDIMQHEIIKPKAVRSQKTPVNIDQHLGISKLSLKDSSSVVEGSSGGVPEFSLRLQGDESDRQSAFHASPTLTVPAMDSTSPSTVGADL